MPQAVVHVLFAIIALDLFRDHIINDKKRIPLHYVLIGGIAGLLPDVDVLLFWILHNFLGLNIPWFHRVFTHTLLFAGIFLVLSLVFLDFSRKVSEILGIVAFGVTFHIILDWLFAGLIAPFYPLSNATYGLELIARSNLPLAAEGFEAIVFILWLWHEEKTHKISDFI